jgi:hypothetical protein
MPEFPAYIDRYDTLECVERDGIIVSMVRRARVINMIDVDYKVLWRALGEARDADGNLLPSYGHNPGLDAGMESFKNLILVERTARLVANDTGMVDVDFRYESIPEGGNQDLDVGDPDGIVYGKMNASIQQAKTNFYRESGDPNKEKKPIIVGHLYKPDDPDFANRYFEQGGEVEVPKVMKTYRFSGTKATNAPRTVANGIIGCVNNSLWMDEEKFTWMVMMVEWIKQGTNDQGITIYRFTFEVQHNPDTWNPTAIFLDERTHRPPTGLRLKNQPMPFGAGVMLAGVFEVPYQRPIDFDKAFGNVTFEDG